MPLNTIVFQILPLVTCYENSTAVGNYNSTIMQRFPRIKIQLGIGTKEARVLTEF